MIWILSISGASTKLRASPFTETVIAGVHSVVYRPGISPVPQSGSDATSGPLGTFARGVHRVSGFVFSYDGVAAETLLGIEDAVDLIVRYRANGQPRRRTLTDVIFMGDAMVTFPSLNAGESALSGVPFRVQIPAAESLADHIIDAVET